MKSMMLTLAVVLGMSSVTAYGDEMAPIPVVPTEAQMDSRLKEIIREVVKEVLAEVGEEMVKDAVNRRLDEILPGMVNERLASMFAQERKKLQRMLDEFREEQAKIMETTLAAERVERAKQILDTLEKVNALGIAFHKEISEQDKELAAERTERIKLAAELREAIAKNNPGLIEGILRRLGRWADEKLGTTAKS